LYLLLRSSQNQSSANFAPSPSIAVQQQRSGNYQQQQQSSSSSMALQAVEEADKQINFDQGKCR
jgi:hypothetical protein